MNDKFLRRYLRDLLLLPIGDFTTIRLLDKYDNVLDKYDNVLFQDYYCKGAENFPKYLNKEIVHISVADNVLKVRLNYFKQENE